MAIHGSFNLFHGQLGLSDNVQRRGKAGLIDRAGLGRVRVHGRYDRLGVEVKMTHPGHLPDAQALGHL